MEGEDRMQSDLPAPVRHAPDMDALARTERFEIKYAGAARDLDTLDHWLRMHRAGFVVPFPPRTVNNTYFDTYALSAYEENLVGASNREKVRLRWYGEAWPSERATLEVKLRRNKLGWKLSYPIAGSPRPDESWSSLRRRVRRALPREARVRFDDHPMPALINRYDRRYFLSGDGRVRATIDTHLRAYDQRFSRYPTLGRAIDLPQMIVVEFKFAAADRQLAADVMRGIPLRVSRSSKYAIACGAMAAI